MTFYIHIQGMFYKVFFFILAFFFFNAPIAQLALCCHELESEVSVNACQCVPTETAVFTEKVSHCILKPF